MVTHAGTPLADHAQLGCAVTAIEPAPPVFATDWLAGEIDAVAQKFAACVSVNVLPATGKVALRSVASGFAATFMFIVALPLPTCGIVIHDG
jgi:hypothetical protein